MPASFKARVDRAARRLAGRHRGPDPFDRKFDDCFEMYDGDAVVLMLMRRAKTDTALRLGIKMHVKGEAWTRFAEKHAHLDEHGVWVMANRLRREGRAKAKAVPASVETE